MKALPVLQLPFVNVAPSIHGRIASTSALADRLGPPQPISMGCGEIRTVVLAWPFAVVVNHLSM